MKVRRVDFYPDDWIAGTVDLSLEERGIYITACALIYSRGGAVERAHLRRACPGHGRPFNAALQRLIEIGKLSETDGLIDQNRCETELRNARHRVEKWAKNFPNNSGNSAISGRYVNRADASRTAGAETEKTHEKPSKNDRNFAETSSKNFPNKNDNQGKTAGYAHRAPSNARERRSQDQQPSDSKNLRVEGLGRCAPSERDASAGAGPPAATLNGHDPGERRDAGERDALTPEERAEMAAKFENLVATLKGGMPRRNEVYDEAAYERAVQEHKRDAWLRELHAWASDRLDGGARTEAWELIDAAMQAGSRDATPRHVRKRLDELDKLYRAEQAQ